MKIKQGIAPTLFCAALAVFVYGIRLKSGAAAFLLPSALVALMVGEHADGFSYVFTYAVRGLFPFLKGWKNFRDYKEERKEQRKNAFSRAALVVGGVFLGLGAALSLVYLALFL
ncbi:MAG: hypothetical protein IJX98_05060 [Clostridia bacterium]|nr:hypothetical protein [Clostridia bacterium]